MKLLYCIPALYNAGGMERVLSEKVNYLINIAGFEITIVTTDQSDKPIRFELDNRINLIHLNIDFDSHFSENLLNKFFLHNQKIRLYERKLKDLVESLNIDVCISLCGKEIAFLYQLSVKCKKIAEIHFAMNNRKQFITARHTGAFWNLLGDIRTYQLKKAVKKLDKLVVLTLDDKKQWENTHTNIVQISNPNPLKNVVCSDLNNKKVISVGKLDPQKGHDMLISAWKYVNDLHPDWELDIFGVGDWQQMLEDKIKQLNLIGSVILKGTTTDVTSQYLNSSIYVMSSRFEGLPLVLLEAMSCGLPIVSFDCEFGPREIITNEIDGFLVEPNNIIELAAKINFLIENQTKRIEMGKNGSENVKRFSKNVIMNQWIDLFNQVLNNR
jgi:glycosyltransferase involved in cell wall biosynthesis